MGAQEFKSISPNESALLLKELHARRRERRVIASLRERINITN
jgi:hypothetical protein